MIYLFLSILCATGLFVIFKLFVRFGVDNFQVNNMGEVALSAFLGFILFRERLSVKNIFGILLALIAILLLTWRGL